MISRSSKVRIALGKNVALLKSYVEPAKISFFCPPPSCQFILLNNEHCEHVVAWLQMDIDVGCGLDIFEM